MYLFDLCMSNIKSEALTQECSKGKVFLKILQKSLENNCVCRSLFYNEGAGVMDKVKLLRSHFTRHRRFLVKFAKFLRTPLRTPTILWNIWETGDDFFMAVKFIQYWYYFQKKVLK